MCCLFVVNLFNLLLSSIFIQLPLPTGITHRNNRINRWFKFKRQAKMVECGICFAEYEEGELELHRELCVVLLAFRCTICNVDFVSKEGLWNHLYQHEIEDESKELHYQEIKAKHKLHQCVLCNDQRAYSESLYWKHVHDAHDGFFLRCSDCGEKFRSEQCEKDHAFSHCKDRDQMAALDFDGLDVDQVPNKVENMIYDCDEELLENKKQDPSLNSSTSSEINQLLAEDHIEKGRRRSNRRSANLNSANDTDTDNSMIEMKIKTQNKRSPKSSETKCLHCHKEYATGYLLRGHIRSCHKPIECSVCGITIYGSAQARKHKLLKHMEPSFECTKCLKTFHLSYDYKRHLNAFEPDDVGLLSPEMNQLSTENPVNQGRGRNFYGLKSSSGAECISGLNLKDSSEAESKIENSSSGQAECHHCGIKEMNPDTLVGHILTHHEPVACDICGITSPSLFQAQDHKKKMHKESKNKCPHCSMQSSRGKQFQKHLLKCKSLRFPCKFCGKMFANMCKVYIHKSNCRAKTALNDRMNVSKEREQQNAETSLSAKNFQGSKEKLDASVIEKRTSPQSGLSETKCYYCDADFLSPGYLRHHLKSYHELTKCGICGISILGIASPQGHKAKCHSEPKFVCPTCGRNFYHKAKYNTHWPTCQRKKYSCEICGRRFQKLHSVKCHKRQEHPDIITIEEATISSQDGPNLSTKAAGAVLEENVNDHGEVRSSRQSGSCKNQIESQRISQPLQQYRCSICEIAFAEFSHIRKHMLTSHTDGMFECHTCSKKFRNFRDMKIHAGVCTDRKISCEFCSKMFKSISSVKNHVRRFHHSKEPLCNAIVKDKNCIKEEKSNIVEETEFEQSSGEHQDQGVNPSSGSGNAKCPYCVKSFANEGLLSRHFDRFHEPCACEICGLTFATVAKANYHKVKCHSVPKFACPACGRIFHHKAKYNHHWSACQRKKYSCDICGHRFLKLNSVRFHKILKHPDIITIKKSTISSQDDSNPSTKADGAVLEENVNDHEKVLSSRQSSTQERNSNNTEEIEPLEDSQPSEKSLASMNDGVDTDGYMVDKETRKLLVATLNDSCKILGKSERISQPLQQYSCSICGIGFTEFSHIKEHMLTSHTDRNLECHTCSKKFRNIRVMKAHADVCAARQFSCEFCSKKFKSLGSVKNHERRFHHSNEPLCNAIVKNENCIKEEKSNIVEEIDFEQSSEEHQDQGVNPTSGSGNAKCPYCVKRFANEGLLSRHIDQYHEPCACEVCGLTFATVAKANYHKMNAHLNDETFKCPYCPKKYIVAERYEQHLSICKSKEFSCDACGNKFTALRNLVKHRKTFHQNEKASRKAQNFRKTDSKIQNQKQNAKKLQPEEISLLHGQHTFSGSHVLGMKEVQTSSTNVQHAGNIDLKLEIKVEDTMLHDQEHQVPYEDQGISCTSTANSTDQQYQHKIGKHPLDSKSKGVAAEDFVLANGIKIKEECQEEEHEENFIGAEPPECNGISNDQNESLVCHDADEQIKIHKNAESEKPFDNSHSLKNRKDVQSKGTKKKLTLDGSKTSKSKRIRIKEEK